MADEPTGQPTPAPTSLGMAPDIPVAPPAPTEPTPTPPQPTGGRSVDELFNEMEELKRVNADLAEKAARAEHEATYTRNLIETFRQNRERPTEQVQPVPEISDDEFLTNPAKATTKVIDAYFQRERAEREKHDREQYVERAKTLFETGKRAATEKNKPLYAGIENEVASQIQQGIINGAINPDAATDPDLWAMTAIAIRYKNRGERNFDRYFSGTHSPMSPVHQETPTPAGPPKAEMTLSPEEEEVISRSGITREQYLKAKTQIRADSEARRR